MSRLITALSPVINDLIWDSPLTRHLAEDARAAAYTRGTVVDLRCGTGLMAREFTAYGQQVIGIDRSVSMLRRARRRGRVTTGIQADAHDTGLPAASAHAVLIFNVLHRHPDPRAVLAEAHRIALPGARIVILSPTSTATAGHFRQLDRRRGWGQARAILADLLRRLFVETHAPDDATAPALDVLVREVTAQDGIRLLSSSTIFDCQLVTILRVAGIDDEPTERDDFALLSHDSDRGSPVATEEHEPEPDIGRWTVSSRPRG